MKDSAGNRNTALTTGNTVAIDTAGPVARLTFSKTSPMGLGTLSIHAYLDEPAVGTPLLNFNAPPLRTIIPITLTGADQNWTGTLDITESMQTGTGLFTYEAVDALGNTGTTLSQGDTIQIDVSKPNAPTGLATQLKVAGQVKLTWFGVVGASYYNLYRALEGVTIDPALDPPLATGITSLSYTDQPAFDINYCWAVSAVNSVINEGPLSNYACATPDRMPPNPPEGLIANAEGAGVRLNWAPPSSGEAASRYHVYRELTPITDVSALAPIKTFLNNTTVVDTPDTDNTYFYAVTALDASDNQSGPSNTVQFLFDYAEIGRAHV